MFPPEAIAWLISLYDIVFYVMRLSCSFPGYCGADLKALCTETALYALRHQFPQIYASKEKLQLDLSQIQVSARDFHLAMQNIVPAAQRAVVSPGRALSVTVRPLLKGQLDFIVDGLRKFFPVAFGSKKSDEKGRYRSYHFILDFHELQNLSGYLTDFKVILKSPAT